MKLNKLLLIIVIILLCSTIYTFINRVHRTEGFDKDAFHKHVSKYRGGIQGIFSKRECNDGRPSSTLERTYDICYKKLDENQFFSIWDIPWISKNRQKSKLQELWAKLKTAFPDD